eukprot:TRINITY_DN50378_c0_g1_i1.p1 TRINITY_DN50378_c0_g1~~TRINITY_DN50378_c0_g1_i1.p1  ORF type:complete len:263 (-),score=48.48 TRINITY_DN50378_c0_g1_i1:109-837(-)
MLGPFDAASLNQNGGETFITSAQQTSAAGASSVLSDVSKLLQLPPDERLQNLDRFARCITVCFRRRPASKDEVDLRRLMPSSLARSPDVWEYTACAICLTDFADGEELRRAPCPGGHAFHAKCLRSWLDRSHATCPVCRGTEADRAADSSDSVLAGGSRERHSPEALAEYVMRRMRAGKADMTISTRNHKSAAQILRQMKEPMPQMESRPVGEDKEDMDDVPSVAIAVAVAQGRLLQSAAAV